MLAAQVVVARLTTVEECEIAIRKIEGDTANTVGGVNAFFSGRQTYLKAGAEKKVQAIQRRMEQLGGESEEGM